MISSGDLIIDNQWWRTYAGGMIVLTVDQRHSRTTEDAVGPTLVRLGLAGARDSHPAAERTAGDELQLLAAARGGPSRSRST